MDFLIAAISIATVVVVGWAIILWLAYRVLIVVFEQMKWIDDRDILKEFDEDA